MFARRNSVASSSNRYNPPDPQNSSLRRSNTTATSRPTVLTKSELLNSTEKKKQAVTAARRAFQINIDAHSKPLVAQHPAPPSRFITPPNRREGLTEIDTNRGEIGPKVRSSRFGAPPESVTSKDYGDESTYSASPIPAGLGRFYAERYANYGDDDDDDDDDDEDNFQGTIVRKRWSMPVQPDSGIRDGMLFTQNTQSTIVLEDDERHDFTPEPVSSTPSSFKRLGRAKSVAAMAPTLRDRTYDQSRNGKRKSASFLRGGTEFLPESMKQQQQFETRERKSFYMPSAARPAFPEDSLYQYKRNERGEWGALRYAVKRKARKISELFGSMGGKLGRKSQEDNEDLGIPEQHVISSRTHFGGHFLAPASPSSFHHERAHPVGPREQPKIRSSFVVSRVPSMHHVHSDEVLHSYQGSIRELTSTLDLQHTGGRYGTVSTCSSLAWNSTISSQTSTLRGSAAPLESIYERDLHTPCLVDGHERIRAPRQRKDRYNVDVRRLYSALVKNLDEKPPVLKPVPPKVQDPVIIGSPSDEHKNRAFQSYRAPLPSASILEKSGRDTVRRSSRVTFEEPPSRMPPPVPERPANYQRRNQKTQSVVAAYGRKEGSGVPSAKEEGPHHATVANSPGAKNHGASSAASTSQSAICGEGVEHDNKVDRVLDVRDHVELHENHAVSETKRPGWNHPMLGSSPTISISSNIEAWKRRIEPLSVLPVTPVHVQPHMSFQSPITGAVSMIHDDPIGLVRSKSVTDSPYSLACYNRGETRTPVPRTRTAFGFTRSGNELGDARMSGRNNRSSIKSNLDISAAVRKQFGPVAGDDDEYDEEDFQGWLNRS